MLYLERQIDIVADFGNLWRAYERILSNNPYKISALRFDSRVLEAIDILQRWLLSGNYKVGPYTEFKVWYPKERDVKTCCFRDKVVFRSLCENVLWPEVEKHLIYDNGASRKGFGTDHALKRFELFLHNHYLNYGNKGYVLKIDVKKFFYSLRHDIIKQQMRKYDFDESIINLLDTIIDSTYDSIIDGYECGSPIGNEPSQVFAVNYLNPIDHYCKDQLGLKSYERYMDDTAIVHQSRSFLQELYEDLDIKYSLSGLCTNAKTQIVPLSEGVTFLGITFYLMPDGKIIKRLKNQNIRHRYSEIHKKAILVACGELSVHQYWQSFYGWSAYAIKADSYKARMKAYKFAKEELKNAVRQNQKLLLEPSYKSGIPIRS